MVMINENAAWLKWVDDRAKYNPRGLIAFYATSSYAFPRNYDREKEVH